MECIQLIMSRYNDYLNLFRNISDTHQYIKSRLLETNILSHFYKIIELLTKAQNKLDIPLESIFKYTIYLYKCVSQGRYLPFHRFLLSCLQHLVLPIEEKYNVYNNRKTSFNTYNYYANY